MALDGGGKTLAVGHPYESAFIVNPDNYQDQPQGTASGAVWLY